MVYFIRDKVEKSTEKCIECSECCKYLAVPSAFSCADENVRDFYEKRGCNLYKNKQGIWMVVLEYPCKYLNPDGKGCSIYENRPYFCKIYDGRNDAIMKDICKLEDE